MPPRKVIPEAERQRFESALYRVTTVPEACKLWKKPRNTLLYAIDAGNLTARKSGKNWLVSVESLIHLWGHPVRET